MANWRRDFSLPGSLQRSPSARKASEKDLEAIGKREAETKKSAKSLIQAGNRTWNTRMWCTLIKVGCLLYFYSKLFSKRLINFMDLLGKVRWRLPDSSNLFSPYRGLQLCCIFPGSNRLVGGRIVLKGNRPSPSVRKAKRKRFSSRLPLVLVNSPLCDISGLP